MKPTLKLILPNKKYLKDWLAFQCETFEKLPLNNPDRAGYEKHLVSSRAPDYFKQLNNDRLGKDLGKGKVQQTTWWGMTGNKIIGRISFRHKLNKELRIRGGHIGYAVRPSQQGKGYATQMLGMVLKKAAKMGYKKVLLTCDAENIASWKTIERNGGKLTKEFLDNGIIERQYWIKF